VDRYFILLPDGKLIYKKTLDKRVVNTLHVDHFIISQVDVSNVATAKVGTQVIIKVECRRDDENGLITHFRTILPRREVVKFCENVKNSNMSRKNNIDDFLENLQNSIVEIEDETEFGTSMLRHSLRSIDKVEKIHRKAFIKKRFMYS